MMHQSKGVFARETALLNNIPYYIIFISPFSVLPSSAIEKMAKEKFLKVSLSFSTWHWCTLPSPPPHWLCEGVAMINFFYSLFLFVVLARDHPVMQHHHGKYQKNSSKY